MNLINFLVSIIGAGINFYLEAQRPWRFYWVVAVTLTIRAVYYGVRVYQSLPR